MYMLAGLGMGDPPDVTGLVGTPAPDARAQMQIDYIRAYSPALSGNDRVLGGNGNDKINGGPGKDHLKGGTGKDTFIFADPLNKTRNLDTISDFTVADDSIWLDNAIFQKLGTGTLSRPGLLNKSFFTIGDKARDSNDYLIYNKTTGYLYYDADASGKGAAVAFAKLSPNLGLSSLDFYII